MRHLLLVLVLLVAVAGACSAGEPTTNSVLAAADKVYLLDLARQTVCWQLKHGVTPVPDESQLSAGVRQKLGCFVTLNHKERGLRGCLGTFQRTESLYKNIISRAVAATQDGRFRADPVTYAELKDIKIDVSVLTEPRDLSFSSPADLLSKLRPRVDGVILYTRYGSSTYLPQVWEQIQRKEYFLSHLCRKHGAPTDTWMKDHKNVRVQTYQAIVFHEESCGRRAVGPKGAVVGEKGADLVGAALGPKEGVGVKPDRLLKGARLAPGAIVTWASDISEIQ